MAEAVEVGVLLGVFDAVEVVVGSDVFVALAGRVNGNVDVFEGAAEAVGVVEAVGVLVDGSPVNVKVPEDFH